MPTTTKQTLTAGAGYGAPVFILGTGATVTAIPGGSGTSTVQYTTSSAQDVNAGLATWISWPAGDVSVATADT